MKRELVGRSRLEAETTVQYLWIGRLTVIGLFFLTLVESVSSEFVFAKLRDAWARRLTQPFEWYASPEAIRIADNVLLYQRHNGGWPKNVDMARTLTDDERALAADEKSLTDSTIDNGATWTELRYLAHVYEATKSERFHAGLLAGIDFLLAAQYPNGGWPQFYPLRDDYSRCITFNDDAMIGVLSLLRDVGEKKAPFSFVDEDRRARARKAVARGIRLILAAQVRVAGQLTVWCAQHDAETLEPRMARSFEPVSLSGSESTGIVRFLMSIDRPSPDVVAAIENAIAWFRRVQIRGWRVERRTGPGVTGGYDVAVVNDPSAPPLWARFYEIATNRPIFAGRDGIVKYALDEIERERRIGYSWLGPYAARLLQTDYPEWARRHSATLDDQVDPGRPAP